jgi:hypothetical protein
VNDAHTHSYMNSFAGGLGANCIHYGKCCADSQN